MSMFASSQTMHSKGNGEPTNELMFYFRILDVILFFRGWINEPGRFIMVLFYIRINEKKKLIVLSLSLNAYSDVRF